jgi:hypothetical protein
MTLFEKSRWQTLNGQLLLILGLFLACILGSITLITQRARLESWQFEKYAPLPAHLQPLCNAACAGQLDPLQFANLSTENRLSLYDWWMTQPTPDPLMPAAIFAADPRLYLDRTERSIICGNPAQRAKALLFLELAKPTQAFDTLAKVRIWAQNRNDQALLAQLDHCVHTLQSSVQGVPGGS